MQEELNQIVYVMNCFNEKYKCKLELETYEFRHIGSTESTYINKLKAVKPERTIAQA